ncbi:trypsin-like serine peptidase [Streptomyces sp. NPDC058701]|uniref:trypsin-like serine peptidase n=1 Tax=Streptomyces sp. NPDC058701 TaxID=3346608 RepID=UPI0036483E65
MLKRGHVTTTIAGLLTTAFLAAPASASTARAEQEFAPSAVRLQVSHQAAALDADAVSAVRRHWSAERVKQAIEAPKSLELPSAATGPAGEYDARTHEPVRLAPRRGPVDGTAAPSSVVGTFGTRQWTGPSTRKPASTIGKLLFDDSHGSPASCTATVIEAETGKLVLTAGHCLMDLGTTAWNTNVVFAPGYSGAVNYQLGGLWVASGYGVTGGWHTTKDSAHDLGFVALAAQNGLEIEDKVGAQGISFFEAAQQRVRAFGYPHNYGDGKYLFTCDPVTTTTTSYHPGAIELAPCDMGPGASGGSWMTDFDESGTTGVGYAVSVTSLYRPYAFPFQPAEIGPQFKDQEWDLYNLMLSY